MLKRDEESNSLFGKVLLIIMFVCVFSLIFFINSAITGEVALLIDDIFYFSLNQGEAEVQSFELENPEEKELEVNFDASDFSKFIISSEKSLTLDPLESKKINLDFFIKEDETPGIYPGKIIITFGTKIKTLNSIVEIKQNKTIFQIDCEILTKKIDLDGELKSKIKIKNIGNVKEIDSMVSYSLIDFDGNVYNLEEEKINLDDELEIERSFKLPENIEPEKSYVLHTKISYAIFTVDSGETFEVTKRGINNRIIYLTILSIAFLIGIIYLIIKIKNRISKISMPKFSLPKFKKPKVSTPKIEKPKISKPKFRFPKIKWPSFHFPRFKLPKWRLPKFKKTKTQIEKSKVKLPKVGRPKIKLSKFKFKWPRWRLPRFRKSKVKIPKMKVEKPKTKKWRFKWPKIRLPKFKKKEISVPEPKADKETTIIYEKPKKTKKKKIIQIKKSKISRGLRMREKKVVKEFMDKFYADLDKKRMKLD